MKRPIMGRAIQISVVHEESQAETVRVIRGTRDRLLVELAYRNVMAGLGSINGP